MAEVRCVKCESRWRAELVDGRSPPCATCGATATYAEVDAREVGLDWDGRVRVDARGACLPVLKPGEIDDGKVDGSRTRGVLRLHRAGARLVGAASARALVDKSVTRGGS